MTQLTFIKRLHGTLSFTVFTLQNNEVNRNHSSIIRLILVNIVYYQLFYFIYYILFTWAVLSWYSSAVMKRNDKVRPLICKLFIKAKIITNG